MTGATNSERGKVVALALALAAANVAILAARFGALAAAGGVVIAACVYVAARLRAGA